MASWFSRSTLAPLRYNRFNFPAVEPPAFSPLDISDCALWLDANDSSTIDVNEDTSGANVNRVMKWFDKAKPSNQNYWTHDGNPAFSGLYNTHYMTQKPTVFFQPNAYMDHQDGGLQFDFNARTFFTVIKPLSNLVDASSQVMSIFSATDVSGMVAEIFYDVSNTVFKYGMYDASGSNVIAFDLSHNPLNERMILMWAHDTDISGSSAAFDTIYKTLSLNFGAKYAQTKMNYLLNSETTGNSLDIAEIIMYSRVLDATEQGDVMDYLAAKWGAARPPKPKPVPPTPVPPIPLPFSPMDISGLYVWMDANDQVSVTVDGSDNVLSWSNLGIAANVFSNDSNYASYTQDSNSKYIVAMPTETTLTTTATLPYLTRTAFVVFENVSDMTLLTYPYTNLWTTSTEGGVQLGVSYDSNTSRYAMTLCQQGLNCPAAGEIPALSVGGYNLAIWACDSVSTSSNYCSFNGGSNLNTSTDLGNLFNTSNISYEMGSPVSGSPEFRIGEILEYDSYLTTAQVSTVADYLVQKWAISSFTTLV